MTTKPDMNVAFSGDSSATSGAEAQSTESDSAGRTPLIQIDKALESWRDAGFDLTAAVGEVVDNSIEARATRVRIRTLPRGDKPKTIDTVVFSDDGIGIPVDVLPHVLSLGYSSRYGQRTGLGRFGVGLKLAALSHARRLDIYTRVAGEVGVRHAWIDLDQIANGEQEFVEVESLEEFPEQHLDLLVAADEAYESGTLVVWNKVDRLKGGGRFQNDLAERLNQVQTFLARAYRRFLDGGVSIEWNSRDITLHDPIFQLENPRLVSKLGPLPAGEIVSHDTIELDGSIVTVTVALPPEQLIQPRLAGGNQLAKDMQIPDNEGKISFLREGREINYDLVAKMFPTRVEHMDRYIGIQVDFPATLDEYFQVRHVKRGVVPVDKLRGELKKTLDRPIKAARKKIHSRWDALAAAERKIKQEHEEASKAAKAADKTSPRGKAGATLTVDEEDARVEKVIDNVMPPVQPDPNEDPKVTEQRQRQSDEGRDELRTLIENSPVTVVDAKWPGRDLFEITHLNGKAVLALNRSHPFMTQVYGKLATLADSSPDDVVATEAIDIARTAETGITLLLMAYAKAENINASPETAYADLRMYWGHTTGNYISEAFGRS